MAGFRCTVPRAAAGRVTISISSPPTPMPVMSSRVTGRPASKRISTQSKPFSFGLRAQPGAPSTACPRTLPTSIRLPGSTGMPKCSILPPTASTAAGITSRRSAMAEAPNTITSSAPALSTASIARASAACSCGTRRSAIMLAPAGAIRAAVTLSVLSTTFGDRPGSSVETMPILRNLVGRDPNDRFRSRRCGAAWSRALTGNSERNDLYRGDHLAFDNRLECRQRRKRDGFVDTIERVDRVLVDDQHACTSANRLQRPVKARSARTPSPADCRGNLGGRLILRHIARTQAATPRLQGYRRL